MIAIATKLKAVLFGGASDGAIVNIESHIEKIKVDENLYVDSLFVDNEGRAVFYCQKGSGKMRKSFINKLFEDENPFR